MRQAAMRTKAGHDGSHDASIKAQSERYRPKQQVEAIRYCADAYFVTLATGKTFTFWEFNLRFKTDSSKDGPPKGKPAIVRAGMQGDRAFVVFSAPGEISTFVNRQC